MVLGFAQSIYINQRSNRDLTDGQRSPKLKMNRNFELIYISSYEIAERQSKKEIFLEK